MISSLINKSGGIAYHISALLRSRRRWQPFREAIERELLKWSPRKSDLIIFGASGGYSLSEKFLARFENIIIVDPDPLANRIFKWRFSRLSANVKWIHNRNLLPWFNDNHSADQMRTFLNAHPNAAILFANVLGQIAFLTCELSSAQKRLAREEFTLAIADRDWASYHDIFSSVSQPLIEFPRWLEAGEGGNPSEFAARFFPAQSEVNDHETRWMSERHATSCLHWDLRPDSQHIVGFVIR